MSALGATRSMGGCGAAADKRQGNGNGKGTGDKTSATGRSKKGAGTAATAAVSGNGRSGKPGQAKDDSMMAMGKLAKTMDTFVSVFAANGFRETAAAETPLDVFGLKLRRELFQKD